jgi:hypothetical protein
VNEVATVPDRQAWWMERLQVLERQRTLAGLSDRRVENVDRRSRGQNTKSFFVEGLLRTETDCTHEARQSCFADTPGLDCCYSSTTSLLPCCKATPRPGKRVRERPICGALDCNAR